ncbi:2-oxoglutarate and iron-dependent oxygenase domain-containing protein 3 isoform X1 [Macaca mulatta]
MAPQRRAATKAPESNGAAERRNRSSTKKDRSPREVQRLWQRPWLRTAGLGAGLVLTTLLLWSNLGAEDGVTEVLARRGEVVAGRFIEVPCSEDYDSHRRFEGCTPRKCGRGVTDVVITREEAEQIRSIAEKGLSLGGSDGGASILDLHSGALSVGKHFVNLYRYFGDKIQNIFSEEDFQLYREVRQKVQLTIAEAFGISASSLHLTKPTFFSRINSTEARTAHDEYWHAHVDKVSVPTDRHLPWPHAESPFCPLLPALPSGDLRLLRLHLAAVPLRLPGGLRRRAVRVHGGGRQQDGGAESGPRLLLHLGVREPAPGGEGPLGHPLCHHHRLQLQPRPRHRGPSVPVAGSRTKITSGGPVWRQPRQPCATPTSTRSHSLHRVP